VVTRLKRGQYFGEIELLAGGENLATIRAAPDTGVEVAALGEEAFTHLIAASEATRAEIAQVVRARIMENVISTEERERA
jgi:CRP-like cAMP-binding protein